MRFPLAILFLGLPAVAGAEAESRAGKAVWPREIVLPCPGASHGVLSPAALVSRDPGVARIEGSRVVAVAPGETAVQAAGEEVRVVVRRVDGPAPIDFENDVLPVLTRSGCNRADCHGAALGQAGFKLSLFGSEPEADYAAITRQLSGRRIDRAEPPRSLILRKPARDLPHKGGRVLEVNGPAYRTLLAWVEKGFPWRESNLELRGLEARGAEAILVRALYSDGTTRDVTELALFSSNDDAIAAVDAHGLITLRSPGATSIMVRFGGLVTAVAAAQPYAKATTGRLEERSLVDRAIGATLARLRLAPSGACDDAAFLRRATLDLTGTLPTSAETRAFLREPDRPRLIEALIARPEFDRYWAYRLGQLFGVDSRRLGEESARAFHEWLRSRVREPWDETARTVLTASGRSPPAGFFRLTNDPKTMAENAARIFLGGRWMCAQCHNHPFESLRRLDYYGFAAFFARVRQGDDGIFVAGRGEIVFPVTGREAPPAFPGGEAAPAGGADRREALAAWLVEQPTLGPALANRVWALLMGRGLVHPQDDLRASNPASHPELLEELGRLGTIVELVRAIAGSAAYERDGATEANHDDSTAYSHALVKPLPAEVLADAIAQVTGIPYNYPNRPPGTRAIDLGDAAVPSYTLDVCGRGRPDFTGSLAQELHLLNGEAVADRLACVEGLLGLTDADLIEELTLRTLSRPATGKEAARWSALLASGPRQEVAEDLLWALINSWEFRTCH